MKYTKQASVVAVMMAIACSGVLLSVRAQAGASSQQQTNTPASQQASTITGCVYQEKDVPGRAPNVAEQAGILEDYILAEVRTPSQTGTPGAAGTSGVAGTSGGAQTMLGTMYKLELVDDEKLRELVGKRVEVTGRIDKGSGDSASSPAAAPSTTQPDKVIGRDRINLAEFEVSSLREVPGVCPAKPASR